MNTNIIRKMTEHISLLPYFKGTEKQTRYHFDSYKKTLAIGEAWEKTVVDYLLEQGIYAYQPKQKFDSLRHYTELQRDVLIALPNRFNKAGIRRRISVEVKSRNRPFEWQNILVGNVEKYDCKRFTINVLVVIDQRTGVTKWALWKPERWYKQVKETFSSKETCYLVPSHCFHPLSMLIEAIKR